MKNTKYFTKFCKNHQSFTPLELEAITDDMDFIDLLLKKRDFSLVIDFHCFYTKCTLKDQQLYIDRIIEKIHNTNNF